jgi:hypothetical protein
LDNRVTAPGGSGTVVAAAGRRVDQSDAAPERFPLRNRARVRDAISSALAEKAVSVLVSSAACGTDLLALEAAGALGIRRRVILPFDLDRFRAQSVIDRPGDWGPLFDTLIADVAARSDLVILRAGEGDHAYAQANVAILAEGDALAAATGVARVALIAWEGASRGPGDLTYLFRAEAVYRGWVIEEVLTR